MHEKQMEVRVQLVRGSLGSRLVGWFNFILRLASLAGKFGLSLYLAAYLSLDELGLYGLVFSACMIAVAAYGGRIDYDLARRIVTMPQDEVWTLLRDQSFFLLSNYMATVPFLFVIHHLLEESLEFVFAAALICFLESYSNFLFANTIFLGKPVLAHIAFFVRSGLWSILVIVAGLAFPSMRTLAFVLAFWALGSGLSIVLNLWFLDILHWPGIRSVPIDWGHIRSALKRSFPIWMGSIGLVAGSYLDRFVLGTFLNLKVVGLATFYTSFSTAVVTLASSSILSVAGPKLVSSADQQQAGAYNGELRRAIISVTAMGVILCVAVAVAVPRLATIMHKPEIQENQLALWLLMGATVVRLVAETAFYGLYSRHKDTVIWVSNIVFLFASLVFNLCLVQSLALVGLGVSSILASLLLVVVRWEGLRPLKRQ